MRGGAHNTMQRIEALKAAEKILSRPKKANATVLLHVNEIKVWPQLFQPREFSAGYFETDKAHVKKLKRAIEINGELDPVVVIKLGEAWACVDGHHRLVAYKKAKWKEKIKCEWFSGNVREAMDESMFRNKKDRLNVPTADRLEEAWKRVLIGGWSKSQIATLCGVATSTIANMRKVKEAAEAKDKFGRAFRKRLDRPLTERSWAITKLIYGDVEPKEITEEMEAQRLAKRLKSRMTDLLSRNANVTAKALALYDPALPTKLMDTWEANPYRQQRHLESDPEQPEL